LADTVDVTLPAMGESVAEGIVARWIKAVGDPVVEGETVAEVTTDKVDVEVPAPASGTLAEILVSEGEPAAVGSPLARIAAGTGAQAPGPPASPAPEPAAAAPEQRAAPPPVAPPPAAPPPAEVAASPLARRAAAIRGVALGDVRPGAPDGVVREADVVRSVAVSPSVGAPRTASKQPGAEQLRGAAAALVEHMERSRDIPTATSFRTVPVAVLDARRRDLNTALSASGRAAKVSFTHLIGYAIARAALEMPEMTARFERDAEGHPLRVAGGPNLGIAVDVRRKDGSRSLVVPVIRDAGRRSFAEFREEYERLVERARNNALSAEDLQDGAITLTNPGAIGTVASVPRLMPGQGTIIAVGAIGYPVEWREVSEGRLRELGVGKVMTMTSTYDHRIIQGAQSGEFLGRVEALLAGDSSFYENVFASLDLAAPGPQAQPAPGTARVAEVAVPTPSADRTMLAAMQAATSLVKAHRTHGLLGAHLDPLGTPPVGDPAMEPTTYGLTPELMEAIPADLLRVYVPGRTLAEVLPNLRGTYCGTIAYEIEHIASHEQRVALREHIESGAYRLPFSDAERLRLLERLTKVDAMERYLRRTFLGQKTFSIEGLDAMVPMLEALLTIIADDGIAEVVMGMAHRGRLATIAHVVNRPYESILNAFELGEQRRAVGAKDDTTGDVKYHLGATGTYLTHTGKAITVRLLPNPSHLEAVDGVVEGWCRATQTHRHAAQLDLDSKAALPILIHGDAAFPGQGVVAEVLNLQALNGYSTGGTIHLIADNQIGFTTDPDEARSTRFASDLAKGFDSPIVHVNADDIEACIAAVRLAYDYRRTYHRDVVIDLVGYRRFGHNETDEPAYTQPLMYQKIREHPTVREIFARRLIEDGLITQADVEAMAAEAYARVAAAHNRVKESLAAEADAPQESRPSAEHAELAIDTSVDSGTLRRLNEELLSFPDGFTPNSKLLRQMERRRASLDEGSIDWSTAEALALATLVVDGRPIRLTGQDTERGTFSQRHLVFHDERTGERWVPMQHLREATASFELHNSPLSEVGCLSFEYGYSAADPETLVIWEAQYGDFINNAQMVVDQFIAAARAKWNQRSRLVLLLPHGYEGSGPEHSSARMERFLQLSANGNMRVANCSTAAQYFHLLRNQALSADPRPLVLFTPKSLLRVKEAGSRVAELSEGTFRTVIDDPMASDRRADVSSLLLCSGRIYYDLAPAQRERDARGLAIARVEMLDPVPGAELAALFRSYPSLACVRWVQEEPRNMGAWEHLEHDIAAHIPPGVALEYVGRPRRASPSEGYAGSHHLEQERIVNAALDSSRRREGDQDGASEASRPRATSDAAS
jgi:multifunctional 2-oxoglutarate metabolism enzyme